MRTNTILTPQMHYNTVVTGCKNLWYSRL